MLSCNESQQNGEYFCFGNYAAVAANMPNREFHVSNVISERSKAFFLAKSFLQKPSLI